VVATENAHQSPQLHLSTTASLAYYYVELQALSLRTPLSTVRQM